MMTNTNTRNTITRSLIAAVVVSAISLPVAAGKYNGSSNNNATYDYAKVVSVDPVIERFEVNEPVTQCWDERVPTYSYNDSRQPKSRTPEVLGAILGGVIGNQIGKRGGGRSRDVATVVGAVLGGSIGHDVKKSKRRHHHNRNRYNNRYEGARYQTTQRCELQDAYITKEQVVGYDVAYKYRGNVFYTQLNDHPGEKIKVKVTVNPV